MTRPSNGARTVAISRCSFVNAISASTAARCATSASTPLTELAADCACNNTALRSASAARCAVLARSTSSAETKPSRSSGSVRRNVSLACSRRHGLFYRGINRVGTKLLCVNATLGEHNLLIQRREGGFSFRQIGFVRARVNAEQQIALFHRLVVGDRQFYNATADFRHHINGIC